MGVGSEEHQRAGMADAVIGEPHANGDAVSVPLFEVSRVSRVKGGVRREEVLWRQIATLVIEGSRVQVVRSRGVPAIALVATSLAGWNLYWIARTIRENRTHR